MSKAILGAAVLGAAVVGGAFTLGVGGVALEAAFNTVMAIHALEALALAGISMEAGAIADALTSNRGTNITTRQPAAFRQIIYGEQRVGGVLIYESTTGSHHDQYNQVIVLAGHVCDSLVNIYLDGRQVHFTGSGVGNSTRNGVNFGGNADGADHLGPGGAYYNFGGLVYVEACFGDQTNQPNTTPGGGYNTGLHANDPNWAPSAQGLPYVGGCTYIYLKVVYDQNQFPQRPEVRVTVRGKSDILDPRTGLRGYTNNWALIVADVIENTQFGLGDVGSVNVAQLIAAANVCDEEVLLASGETEKRYALNAHFDTSLDPGSALDSMMSTAAGRLSRIGGEWYIWPAYWQGPSLAFGAGDLAEGFQWNPTRSFKDLINRVTGTYTAPNYPYNATRANGSNLYDTNGFGPNGELEDTFSLAFQPTSFPQYAVDQRHGYPADQYLNEDGGVLLPRELNLQWCCSLSQAQRVAKIYLLRNRMQGTGKMTFKPVGFQMQPLTVIDFTFATLGWQGKQLEIGNTAFDPMTWKTSVDVNETAASVYQWSALEELTIYDTPAGITQAPYTPAAPGNLELTSSAATALVAPDGVVTPRVLATWDEPLDGFVTQMQLQFQGPVVTGQAVPAWQPGGIVGVINTSAYLNGLLAGSTYNVRIRSLRANGAASPWVEVDGYTVSVTISTIGGQLALHPGVLISQAYADGTASIIVPPFTASIGGLSVALLPGGAVGINSLQQGQLYYVYYIDPTFAGGNIMPIATQNRADFSNKVGYFLIDSIVTRTFSAGGGGGGGGGTGNQFLPTIFTDMGARSTQSPSAAYDSDTTTVAVVSAQATAQNTANASGQWSGFPNVAFTGITLSILLDTITFHSSGTLQADGEATVSVSVGGTVTQLASYTAAAAGSTLTFALPPNTNLSTVTVWAAVTLTVQNGDAIPRPSGATVVSLPIKEIFIQ